MTVLSDDHVRRIAGRARALSDPTRVRIVFAVQRAPRSVGQIATALSLQQSTISKHLQVLFREGLVVRERAANSVFYSLADDALLEWCRYFSGINVRARRT